jgi:hypothetical protein
VLGDFTHWPAKNSISWNETICDFCVDRFLASLCPRAKSRQRALRARQSMYWFSRHNHFL